MATNEHLLTTYIRTKTIFKRRLKDLADYDTVKIYVYELDKLRANSGPLLYHLRETGEIWYDKDGNFKAINPDGPINPSLLEVTKKRPRISAPLTPLHVWMMQQLLHVKLSPVITDIPVYFKAFLEHRREQLHAFFTVDAFAGRVHTPVVNLKGELRKAILFHGKPVVSLDVKQMQPLILGKVLHDSIGSNPFSDACLFKGEDVYILLQKSADLQSRDEAKRLLFRLIFGKPMDKIRTMFKGDSKWVDWINEYKSNVEPMNPHKSDKHTNLAWLLQYSEVQIMTGIWQGLMNEAIPFLTIHDDVLCRPRDKDRVYDIMTVELNKHFPKFTIVVDHKV